MYNKVIEINKVAALFGVSKQTTTTTKVDAQIRKQVNHIMLNAKLAILKHRYENLKTLMQF